jgi:organic radical activating enzyme
MLAETVNCNQIISQVHFTGGEPSLFLEEIKALQKLINRPVLYAMTTNGSNPISSIKLDEIIFSYDKFHSPFITPEEIIAVADDAKQRGLSVVVNSVFSDVSDIAAQTIFSAHQIQVVPSRIVYSGRAKTQNTALSWKDTSALAQTCPSIQREQRRNEREKIMFIPTKGFTPCCGPLA